MKSAVIEFVIDDDHLGIACGMRDVVKVDADSCRDINDLYDRIEAALMPRYQNQTMHEDEDFIVVNAAELRPDFFSTRAWLTPKAS